MRKAVIDVGSNSVLLLVAEKRALGWEVLHESTAVTALGEGTKQTGLLSEKAMSATLLALSKMFEEARSFGVDQVRAGGTMALRIGTNASDFFQRAEAQGTPVELISGEREAELGFKAVASDPSFSDLDTLSIIDPGGHSTELVTAVKNGDRWIVKFRKSFPIGTLALRGDRLSSESPNSLDLLRACKEIDGIIGLEYRPGLAGTAVVLGATGTNLISIREKMLSWQPEKVHGVVLDYEEVSRAMSWLSAMTDAERAAVPGMEPGRQKTIHLGALILERFLYALHVLGCRVSVRGWRYALLDDD